jgi:hypothetical protein
MRAASEAQFDEFKGSQPLKEHSEIELFLTFALKFIQSINKDAHRLIARSNAMIKHFMQDGHLPLGALVYVPPCGKLVLETSS